MARASSNPCAPAVQDACLRGLQQLTQLTSLSVYFIDLARVHEAPAAAGVGAAAGAGAAGEEANVQIEGGDDLQEDM